MRSQAADRAVFLLCLAWGTALFAAVAVLQRPLFAPELLALAAPAWGVVVALGVGAAALGVGSALTRALALPGSATERWLVSALLGLGTVGLAWLWMGMVRLPPAGLTVVLLAALAGLLAWAKPTRPSWPSLPRPLALLLLALGGLSLLQALEPATSFDALLYHLRLPELWLAGGTVFQPQRDAPYFFPVLVEALLVPALQLGGEGAAGTVAWLFFPLLLGLLWALTRRFLPETSAPLTLAFAATIQMVPLLAGWTYTDLPLACYTVGAVWALLHWREAPESGWLWVAAAFTGMALGIKYLAVLVPLLAVAFIVQAQRRAAARPVVGFTLVALGVGSASLVRNFVATGNPVFPFALPSPFWDPFRAAWYAAAGTGIGASLPTLLAVPWLATLGLRDTSYFDGRPGPLLATFVPLAWWLWARSAGSDGARRVVGVLSAFAGAMVALWLVGIVQSAALWQGRFLIPPLLLLCPVAAWGVGQLEQRATLGLPAARLSYGFVAAWAALALLIAATELQRTDPAGALLGQPSRDGWLATQLGSYHGLRQAVNALPADARPLLLFEPRAYGMAPQTDADTLLYEWAWRLHRAGGDPQLLGADLCAAGYTHVGVYWAGARFLHQEGTANRLSDEAWLALQRWSQRQESLWQAEQQTHELLRLRCP